MGTTAGVAVGAGSRISPSTSSWAAAGQAAHCAVVSIVTPGTIPAVGMAGCSGATKFHALHQYPFDQMGICDDARAHSTGNVHSMPARLSLRHLLRACFNGIPPFEGLSKQ